MRVCQRCVGRRSSKRRADGAVAIYAMARERPGELSLHVEGGEMHPTVNTPRAAARDGLGGGGGGRTGPVVVDDTQTAVVFKLEPGTL